MVKYLPATQWIRLLGGEDPLEKETANHSGILAWEIPWTEEPGGLQTMRLQKNQTGHSDSTTIFGFGLSPIKVGGRA